MKERPNRSTRSAPPTRTAPPSGRPRTSQRGGSRQQQQNTRSRQLIAVGALVVVLAVVAAVVYFMQQGQPPTPGTGSLTASLPNESVGHFRGNANAPVTVTEWSEFQ